MTTIRFGDDAIIRTDEPTTLRCHGINIPLSEMPVSRCRSGCKTKDHASYAECCQDAGLRTYQVRASMNECGTAQKKWDRELASYYSARKEGIRPDGTTTAKIDQAKRLSDAAGAAYGRDFSRADPMPD